MRRRGNKMDRKLFGALLFGVVALIVLLITVVIVDKKNKPGQVPEDVVEDEVDSWTEKVTNWLWMVDEEHALPISFEPDNLEEMENTGIRLQTEALKAFTQMTSVMDTPVFAANGYISASAQQNLYESKFQEFLDEGYTQERAAMAIKEYYSPGGQDEHQLGLTVDVCADSERKLDYEFRSTDQGRWLSEHAWEYGFVFRSESKPWQIRYVGDVHAQIMHEQGLSLEEYLSYLQEKGTLYVSVGQANLDLVIYYTDTLDKIPFAIKEVSGDNNGHYIVTCYR